MYTAEEYKTYLKVKHALLYEDAKNNVVDFLENEDRAWDPEEILNDFDYEELIAQFEAHFDHYDPFADVWQNVVRDYFENL